MNEREYWIKVDASKKKICYTLYQGRRYDKKTNLIQISLIDLFKEFKNAFIHSHKETVRKNKQTPT
jgi:hypothetical protein